MLACPRQECGVLRPARVAEALLKALEASEGRRRSRKRDQTPDAFGLSVKRALLQAVVMDDPAPEAFEAWLLHFAGHAPDAATQAAATAMGRLVFDEWCLARHMAAFAAWLEDGARSEDAAQVARRGQA